MLYNLTLKTVDFLLKILPNKSEKLKDMVRGRKNLFEELGQTIDSEKPIAWFHCASLGEFEQARELIKCFKEKFTTYKILLTFFSPSGYNIRKNYEGVDYVFYLPIDTKRNAKRFIEIVKPQVVIIIKYEFWRNIISEIKKSGAKLYIVSAIFKPNKPFFKWWGGLFRNILRKFDYIFVQDTESVELLNSIGITNCRAIGDTRFDRVYNIVKDNISIDKIDKFCVGEKVFITGSSWDKDTEITKELIVAFPKLKFIIAPHELEEKKIEALYDSLNLNAINCIRYTKETPSGEEQVMILDTIGVLSHVYKYGRFAYIGGGFGAGIHNTLEAATFALPLIFGPNNKKFKEAQDLLAIGAATEISCSEDAKSWLNNLLSNPELEWQLSNKCRDYIDENRGACDLILEKLSHDLRE